MKIMFINFQGGIRVVNSYFQYAVSGWKYVLPHSVDALDELVDFIQKEDPDVISFAEIEGSSWRGKNIDQVSFISEKTNLKYSNFFSTLKIGAWINQGNAILSRYPLKNIKQIKLPGNGEKRYLCSADIIAEDQEISCYTTHLSTNKKINIAQQYFIAKKMRNMSKTSVLLGDFNITKEHLNTMKSVKNFNDVKLSPSFPSWRPVLTLDHIFLSKTFNFKKAKTFNGVFFSDHLPISVEVY